MKFFFQILALSFFLVSCSHNIPTANLSFNSIVNDDNINSYFLSFNSDIELNNSLKNKHLGARFKCVLERDYDQFILLSLDTLNLTSKSNNLYTYQVDISFHNDSIGGHDGYSILKLTEKEALLHIAQLNEDCIECEIHAVAFFGLTKEYHSNPMCLPKEKVLEASKK